jgi:ParB family chromosome partitioning protein
LIPGASNPDPDSSGVSGFRERTAGSPLDDSSEGRRPLAESSPTLISVNEIDPNPEQPRRVFDPALLDELSRSIQRHGVLQPIVVRRAGFRFELIVGERRWRATQLAGLKTVPAVIADIETRDRLEIAIIENVQRQDLNPIELAHAYRALVESGATQEEVGEKVSKNRSSVSNHLRLLDLSRDLQQDIEEGRITMGHAKALLQVSNPERRHHLRNRVVNEQLSVRESEILGRDIAGPVPRSAPRKARKEANVLDPALTPVLEALQKYFQTRVKITGGAERGKIEIEYFQKEELDRLVRLLLGGRH